MDDGAPDSAFPLDANTGAIIRLGWARRLGLDDHALLAPGEPAERDADGVLSVVRLFEATALVGPGWARDAVRGWPSDRLMDPSAVLDMVRRRASGRIRRTAVLAYADRPVVVAGLDEALISDDPDLFAAVEDDSPPDDVAQFAVAGLGHRFVLVDHDGRARAAAGYQIWAGLLAELKVLTRLSDRRRGYGRLIAAAATNDAVDSGLVAQWRADRTDHASRALAARLGYRTVGGQTTVELR